MKKRLQGVMLGVLIGSFFACGMVYAKQASELAEIYYNNIKIFINGGEIVPKDANGNIVDPFIVNGTTYLPVRAISNAFGKDVEWDGETQSIYIGKNNETKPDNYLHKIQYNDYKAGTSEFTVLDGTVTDYNDDVYTSGLLFRNYTSWGNYGHVEDEDRANILIAYPLNSQYSRLKGKFVLPKEFDDATMGKGKGYYNDYHELDLLIYGDGKLLYEANTVTPSMPFDFDVKVKGINQLVIKIRTASNCLYDSGSLTLQDRYILIADPALYR